MTGSTGERGRILGPSAIRMVASALPLDLLVCTDPLVAEDALPLFREVHLLDPAAERINPALREPGGVQVHYESVPEGLVRLGAEFARERVLFALSAEHDPQQLGGMDAGSVLILDGALAGSAPDWSEPGEDREVIDLGIGLIVGPPLLKGVLAPLVSGALGPGTYAAKAGSQPSPDEQRAEALINQLRDRNRRLEDRIASLRMDLAASRGRRRRSVVVHRLRKLRARLRPITGVRLGLLWHYRARELRIPASYSRTKAPDPAPSISIVVPTFNQGSFIARTLDSVLDQQYPDLELIVQDGGSSDATVEVLAAYGERLAHIASGPDGGQAAAINAGFAHAQGEIMAWLNSDDLLLPGALAYVARYFVEHPNVDVIYGHRVLIDDEDEEIGRWVMPAHDEEVLRWADYVPQETLFWRRAIWEQAGGGVDEGYRFALDWELLHRMSEAGATVVRVPRFLGAFRVHEQQKSSAQVTTLGHGEMDRLRRRIHGRPVSPEETQKAIRPYLRRHALLDKLYRLRLLRY